jgi:PAS domain-containing protein
MPNRRQEIHSVQQKDDQLRQVFDAIPTVVHTTDAKGTISYYNRAAGGLAGREPTWSGTSPAYLPRRVSLAPPTAF